METAGAHPANSATQRKPTLDPREALDNFFQTPWLFYFEHELEELGKILEDNGMVEWSRTPKLYFILNGLGSQHLISSFVANGISDDSIPLEGPTLLSKSFGIKSDFLKRFETLQSKIVTQPLSTYEAHLEAYLDPDRDLDKNPLDDVDFLQIGRLLDFCGKSNAAKTPKLYYVLHSIGQLAALPEFLARKYSDMWFPFPNYVLRAPLVPNKAARVAFLNAQEAVCSSRWSEDVHLNFSSDDHDFLVIQKSLGIGGSGEVTHVYCPSFRRHYAQKLIHRRDGLRFFANEVKKLKSINHRHCVSLVCSYTDPDYLAILAQPVADMNLGNLLEAPAIPMDRKQLLQTFFGCLSTAVSYLHARGIRHKDIKPENILIHRNNVLFTDFGLSADSLSGTTSIAGNTPRYNSPEYDDGGSRDEASDIWSLGCVFFEILAALQGMSISNIKGYFRARGTRREAFNANPEAVNIWLANECSETTLASFSKMAMVAKKLTSEMLVHAKDSRPNSHTLVERFGQGIDVGSSYYGSCCREELRQAARATAPGSPEPGPIFGVTETLSEEPTETTESANETNLTQNPEESLDQDDGSTTITNLRSAHRPTPTRSPPGTPQPTISREAQTNDSLPHNSSISNKSLDEGHNSVAPRVTSPITDQALKTDNLDSEQEYPQTTDRHDRLEDSQDTNDNTAIAAGQSPRGDAEEVTKEETIIASPQSANDSTTLNSPVKARVVWVHEVPGGDFAFIVEALMADGWTWSLKRSYGEFYSLHLDLKEAIPKLLGPALARRSAPPMLPPPGPFMTRTIALSRLDTLDKYLKKLVDMRAVILRYPAVLEFFKPKGDDGDIPPPDEFISDSDDEESLPPPSDSDDENLPPPHESIVGSGLEKEVGKIIITNSSRQIEPVEKEGIELAASPVNGRNEDTIGTENKTESRGLMPGSQVVAPDRRFQESILGDGGLPSLYIDPLPEGLTARALFNWDTRKDGELALLQGDVITNITKINGAFCTGTNPLGDRGVFPLSYVEVVAKKDLGDVTALPRYAPPRGTHSATVLYDFQAEGPPELSISAGAKVQRIEFVRDDWWYGTDADGKFGYFPSSYVKLDDTPPKRRIVTPGEEPEETGPDTSSAARYPKEDSEIKIERQLQLILAAKDGNAAEVRRILSEHPTSYWERGWTRSSREAAIKSSILDDSTASEVLSLGGDVATYRFGSDSRKTAYRLARAHGHQDVMKVLTENGVDFVSPDFFASIDEEDSTDDEAGPDDAADDSDEEPENPLSVAAEQGDVTRVRHLLRRGAEIDERDYLLRTPLIRAAMKGHHLVTAQLCASGADVNAGMYSGWTALHAAAWNGYGQVVDTLLTYKANVDLTHRNGSTPLHEAVRRYRLAITSRLIDAKADLNVKTGTGMTALDLAQVYKHQELIVLLIKNGATNNKTLMPSPVHRLAADDVRPLDLDREEPGLPQMSRFYPPARPQAPVNVPLPSRTASFSAQDLKLNNSRYLRKPLPVPDSSRSEQDQPVLGTFGYGPERPAEEPPKTNRVFPTYPPKAPDSTRAPPRMYTLEGNSTESAEKQGRVKGFFSRFKK